MVFSSGTILPTDNIKITGEMSTVMKDLAADTFCVPINHIQAFTFGIQFNQ